MNNVILSRLPLHDCVSITLPPSQMVKRENSPFEKRSAAVSTVHVNIQNESVDGSSGQTVVPVTIVATHLCHLREENRVYQMKTLQKFFLYWPLGFSCECFLWRRQFDALFA